MSIVTVLLIAAVVIVLVICVLVVIAAATLSWQYSLDDAADRRAAERERYR